MTSFGQRIRVLAARLGKEEQKLAEELGLSKSQLSHYINGNRKVPSEVLQKIVDTYNINPLYLFKEETDLFIKEDSNTRKYNERSYNFIPIPVSAGNPLTVEAITQADKITIADAIMGKYAGHKDIFITRISGDSMNKLMEDGSLIAVKPTPIESLKNGDIVVFSYEHEYSVKHFYKNANKVIFKPNSTNDCHHEQHFTDNDNITIHGKVITYIVNLD